jgi:signal transduction histidine kinase
MLTLVVVALVYLAVPVLAIGIPSLTTGWLQRPFIGVFVERSLRINDIDSTTHTPFTGREAGLTSDDRIVSVEGVPVSTPAELYEQVSQFQVGDPILFQAQQVEPESAPPRDLKVRLMRLPLGDVFSRLMMPYLTGLIYLSIGLWVYRSRRDQASARVFLMMCASMALILGSVFDLWTTHVFERLWTAALPLAGATAAELGTVFPYEPRMVGRRPFIRLWPYFLAVPLIILSQIFLTATPDAYLNVWQAGYYFAALSATFLVGMMFLRSARAASPVAREQARIVLVGSALAFTPFTIWVIAPDAMPVEVFLLAFAIFPLAIGYAILRYRLLDSEWLLSRAITYFIMGLLVVIGYTLLVAGASLLLSSAVPASSPILIATVVFLTILAFNPLRTRLQATVDNLFFRSRKVYETRLQAFSQVLSSAGELEEVWSVLRKQIDDTIHPTHMYMFLLSQDGDEFVAVGGTDGGPGSDIRFSVNGALASILASSQEMIYLEAGRPVLPELLADQTLLAVLRTPVLAPLISQNRLIGWLAVGPRRARAVYRISDLQFIEGLTQQAALAVERAQALGNLQRHVRELDVLSQVSQAVNFTLDFDDLLELIYTQASKVVETTNFYIILYDKHRNTLRYAFFLENNERLEDQEGEFWSAENGLAGDVVRSGRPIRTDSYVDECDRRDLKPHNPHFQAWMGVPLNVGVSTLGVMVVSSYKRGETFSDEQLKVFWAIADQAASALDKARLFADAEARALQLATLNRVSNTLASTLDLEQLLSLVLVSAVEILVAEAGSLLLIDPETGELVFRVMEGGAEELVGTRLQPGIGLVGAVAQSAEPIIVADVSTDPRWFANADEDTGFKTETVVAVPLQVQDRVIGVLELLNKRSGASFTEDDATLLTTFAGQAAVAIENARLYYVTDQALSDRVDELSMLQRIDRELNTTLEVDRVIQITLDWALRVSGASAGAVGMVNEEGEGIHLLASQGYEELDEQGNDTLPILQGSVLERVMSSGKPELVEDASQEAARQTLNSRTITQMAIPILRVNEVVGVLMLESSIPAVLTMEDLDFINRLTEHASVAISNAHLFQEVEAANRAKTEFVSFVSHELKTPMTSIKGYTDLLMTGQVGDITDMQTQFLSTIRSNVDRMSRLVSDLADTSRIESGHLRLEMSPIPFSLVIEETLRSTQGQIEEKNQALTIDVEDELPLIQADQTRMIQVLTNLMSNAYKYTPEGGEIFITATTTQEQGDGGVFEVIQVAVRDTGIGMSPEDLEQLFTKFFRSNSVKGSVPGTGLGLNITKNLIELHGGHIWVDSLEGEGTTFTYTVPVAQESEQPEA